MHLAIAVTSLAPSIVRSSPVDATGADWDGGGPTNDFYRGFWLVDCSAKP